ncbi:MAG TPA: phytanoyl-CoA dioxygenase family protein [Tepidisphaeraceae bacterium]
MQITTQQMETFRRDGFMVIPQLIDAAAVALLREHYDRFLRREIDASTDKQLGGKIRQILMPSQFDPIFLDNPALTAARDLAGQLLHQPSPPFVFDMLISKEPGNTSPTPWHQDFAYHNQPFVKAGTPITNTSLQFWVALDDVDLENGCMHFIPGQHEGPVKPHYVASGDPANERRLLATDAVDATKAVACPLQAGGCTIHMEGTPHYTPGNTSKNRSRRAYIFNYGKHLIPKV